MRKIFYMVISLMLIILTGCGTYSGKDIAKSIEKISTEETQKYIPLPSNRRVNEEKKRGNTEVSTYSEQFGYYLKQFNNKVDQMKDFFYAENPTETSLVKVKQQVHQLQSFSDEMTSYKVPKELIGLDNIHKTTLRELDLLAASIDAVALQDIGTFQRAKFHFENMVISVSMCEREYLAILTKYGLK